ncbi:MAG: S8 family serine peptidase, partial [Lachnospiraceae bacterium]|nr:S8 family serine peptidase [Lachnospiraceae bacterium]
MRSRKRILRRGIAGLLAALIVWMALPDFTASADQEESSFDPVTETRVEEESVLPEDSAETETEAETEGEAETEAESSEETEAEAETESSEEAESPEETEAEPEEETSEETETAEEPETAENLFGAISDDSLVSMDELNSIDFTSCRLILAWEEENIPDPEHIIASYEGVHILQYEDAETAAYAFSYYYGKAYFTDVDSVIMAADGGDGEEASSGMDGENNPLRELQEALDENHTVYSDRIIALIDTGVNGYEDHLVESVSMIGDDLTDGSGHGTAMAGFIVRENPYVKILSIKALRNDGSGDISAVYAAIRYAIDKGVSVINLSISAAKKLDSASIVSIINEAAAAGITVVGAAGNNGADAAFFIPGSIPGAVIIGAANDQGERLEASNYGSTVDYNVVAEATSIAAAKYTGYMSLHGSGEPDYRLIFPTDYVKPEEEPEITAPEVVIEDTALFRYFSDHVRRDLSAVNREDLVDTITHKLTFVSDRIWKDTNGDGVTDLFDIYYNGSDDYLTESYTKNTYAGFYNLDDASPYLVAYLPMESEREYVFRSFDLTVENNDGQVIKDEYYVFDPASNLLYVSKAWFEIPWENGIIGSLRSQSVYTFSEGTITDLTKKVHIKAEFSVDDGYEAPEDAEL